MKAIAPIIGILLLAIAAFGGYLYGQNKSEANFDQGVLTGQFATIVQVVNQALEAPCQTINLYNKSDEANPKEVNLINITCEGLNLPDINEAEAIEQ